jgi:hypothetical protein
MKIAPAAGTLLREERPGHAALPEPYCTTRVKLLLFVVEPLTALTNTA